MHLRAVRLDINRAHLRAFFKTITGDGARHLAQNIAYRRVVGTQNSGAVKRHAVQKINKRLLELAKVVPVGFHVVGVNVGHHRHHRHEVQKRGIRLICLYYDVVATAQPRVGPRAVQAPANHKGGV